MATPALPARSRAPMALAALTLVLAPAAFTAPALADAGAALLPDLQTVVPLHLNLVNEHQREVLRFSNGVANTGAGDWRMRPEFPLDDTVLVQQAIQELLDADGNLASEKVVSEFQWHESHNHWHIGGIALFEVRPALDDGTGGAWGAPLPGNSIKTTFCLIDWYALEGNSPAHERTYFDCNGSHQGIAPGWVDQYHQATSGQQLDITGAAEGIYYLVSVANPDGVFLESDAGNNAAWTSFELRRHSNGNPKIEAVAHSACATPGLCGEGAPNR